MNNRCKRSVKLNVFSYFSSNDFLLFQLNADVEEIKRLLGQATRSRVKQALELQQRRFETDLINLKEKQEQTVAATTEKKTAAVATPASRAYTKEITVYGNE